MPKVNISKDEWSKLISRKQIVRQLKLQNKYITVHGKRYKALTTKLAARFLKPTRKAKHCVESDIFPIPVQQKFYVQHLNNNGRILRSVKQDCVQHDYSNPLSIVDYDDEVFKHEKGVKIRLERRTNWAYNITNSNPVYRPLKPVPLYTVRSFKLFCEPEKQVNYTCDSTVLFVDNPKWEKDKDEDIDSENEIIVPNICDETTDAPKLIFYSHHTMPTDKEIRHDEALKRILNCDVSDLVTNTDLQPGVLDVIPTYDSTQLQRYAEKLSKEKLQSKLKRSRSIMEDRYNYFWIYQLLNA